MLNAANEYLEAEAFAEVLVGELTSRQLVAASYRYATADVEQALAGHR